MQDFYAYQEPAIAPRQPLTREQMTLMDLGQSVSDDPQADRMKLNDLLSKNTVSSEGMIGGKGSQTLAALSGALDPQRDLQERPQYQFGGGQAPLNTLVNNRTGASYQFGGGQAPLNSFVNNQTGKVTYLQPAKYKSYGGENIDMSRPATFGSDERYYPLKNDPTTYVNQEGRRINPFVDWNATQAARDADMKRQIAQADLEAKQIANRNNQVSIEDRALQEQRGKLRAQNEVWQSLPPKMRDAEEARRLGIKLEKGQQYNSDTGQVETIRGSKLGMQIQEDRQELVNGTTALKKEYDSARDRIAKILGNPNWESAVGWIQGNIPMTLNLQDRATVASNIMNLAEQLQVQGLKNLRQGGVAPGSITEKEWSKFVAGFGNLDPTQDEKSFKNELQGLLQRLDSAEASREGLLKEFDSRYVWTDKDRGYGNSQEQSPQSMTPVPQQPKKGMMRNGYVLVGDDPRLESSWKKIK